MSMCRGGQQMFWTSCRERERICMHMYCTCISFKKFSSTHTHTHTNTEGAKFYSSNDDLEPSVVPMLFTYITGEHLYTVGLRFSRPFFISRTPNSRYYSLTPWSKDTPPRNSKLIYLPTCCVLVSKRPYFKFMKDALSG